MFVGVSIVEYFLYYMFVGVGIDKYLFFDLDSVYEVLVVGVVF